MVTVLSTWLLPVWKPGGPLVSGRSVWVGAGEHRTPGPGSRASPGEGGLGGRFYPGIRPGLTRDSSRWWRRGVSLWKQNGPFRGYDKRNSSGNSNHRTFIKYTILISYLSNIFSASGIMELIPMSNAEKILVTYKENTICDVLSYTYLPFKNYEDWGVNTMFRLSNEFWILPN